MASSAGPEAPGSALNLTAIQTVEAQGPLASDSGTSMSVEASTDSPSQPDCPRCGKPSQPGMRYCLFCGASVALPSSILATPAHMPSAMAAPAPQAQLQPKAQVPPLEQRLVARGELEPHRGQDTSTTPPGRAGPTAAINGAAATAGSSARLVTIAKDGAEGASYLLSRDQVDIGREEGTILLREDPYISLRHVRISRREDGFYARDLESLNGFFIRLREVRPIEHGDLLLVGLQVLRFEVVKDGEQGFGPASQERTLLFGSPMLPRHARLIERTVEGIPRSTFYLHREETILGREAGDIVFTDDPFMSRRHLAIRFDPKTRTFTAADLNSSNGTYVAVRGETKLTDGDQLRMGQHLFRFECGLSWPSKASAGGPRRAP